MKIAVLQASSQISKNELLFKYTKKYAKNSEVINYGCFSDDSNNYCGIVCVSGRYAVERNADGSFIIYDLLGGVQTASDNITLQDTDCTDMVLNPDGTKLLLIKRNGSNGTLVRLSVLDMENTSFIAIDRDPAAVGNEHLVDWFDNETVLVDNNIYDTLGNNSGDSWYYLYHIGE